MGMVPAPAEKQFSEEVAHRRSYGPSITQRACITYVHTYIQVVPACNTYRSTYIPLFSRHLVYSGSLRLWIGGCGLSEETRLVTKEGRVNAQRRLAAL